MSTVMFSQQKAVPGAVDEPHYWIKIQNNSAAYYWDNKTINEAKITSQKHDGAAFNFNPSITFDTAKDSLILPLGTNTKRKQTLFMVYKVQDSLKEQFLWTVNDPTKTLSVATNKRLVDLKKYSYRSYQDNIKPQKANIHFFQQNVTDSVAKLATLSIGKKTKFEQLPPDEFKGNISEILVYNRVLSKVESQKVASYLAIKYGITLSQFDTKNYLNSKSETIWDHDKHKGYDALITGLGRDDASGLLQLRSSNMVDEGLLTIGLRSKSNIIPNNYFVFWSDNGKNLLVKKQEQGGPVGISREWALDFTNPTDLSLDWSFNPKFIKGTLAADSYYWLLVDYSGSGSYKEGESEYVRLSSTASKELLVLDDFDWDKLKTGKVNFTLKIAPEMFSSVWITEATCGVAQSGALNYSIEGGQAPYTITVKKEGSDVVVKQWKQTAKNAEGIQLSSGTYEYIVRDVKGNLYSETIFIADKQGTNTTLKSAYMLTDGNALTLDASVGLVSGDYDYEWLYEGNFIDNNPKILIDQPGSYELRLSNSEGCKTSSKITVSSDGKDLIDRTRILLYPNPITEGSFSIAMQYPNKNNVSVTIYTPSGALVKQQHFNQIETYLYEDFINGPAGMYLINVSSDFGNKVFKVIVK